MITANAFNTERCTAEGRNTAGGSGIEAVSTAAVPESRTKERLDDKALGAVAGGRRCSNVDNHYAH